jgi:hypothetical protein
VLLLDGELMSEPSHSHRPHSKTAAQPGLLSILLAGLAIYFVIAYAALPTAWRVVEDRHPALRDGPRITRTKSGIPGDPLNIALVGTEEELHRGMHAAGWLPADPITLRSSLRISADSVFRRPYPEAPVSNLYVRGRKQDYAFEQAVGPDPRQRHHVRFWQTDQREPDGRPLWIGAATLDTHVGFSHTTGQITHHIGPNVDAERDKILDDLQAAGWLTGVDWIAGYHTFKQGRNGGGDPWKTDGRLGVGLLKAPEQARETASGRGDVDSAGASRD